MFNTAPIVSVGAVPALGVEAANKVLQAPSLPVVLMQLARIFAIVFNSETGTVAPAGNAAPGAPPVLMLLNLFTAANAFARPATFVALVPTFVYELINGASA